MDIYSQAHFIIHVKTGIHTTIRVLEAGTETHKLPPEMRFTIERGWGTLTVQNPDPAQAGEIGYLTVNVGG